MSLFLFDVDGTLIETTRSEKTGKSSIPYETVKVLDGRREKLATLDGPIAFVTNQGGVAFGFQTESEVLAKMERVWDALGLERTRAMLPDGGFDLDGPALYVCFAHPFAKVEGYKRGTGRRKPSPAMIYEAMHDHGAESHETVFVGDMETDQEAAELAGVRYFDAEEFFALSPAPTSVPR